MNTASPLLDWPALKARGVVKSRPTLFRYLKRADGENPFPRPMRDTRSGRRFWRESDVQAWQERERIRAGQSLESALAPDEDPARWAPGRRREAANRLL